MGVQTEPGILPELRTWILESRYLHRRRNPDSYSWLFSGISLNTDVYVHVSKLPASGIRGLEVIVLSSQIRMGLMSVPTSHARKLQDS